MEGGVVNASSRMVDEAQANVGAEVMGRGKFARRGEPRGDAAGDRDQVVACR
jgi:hypothetical protein